MAIPSILRVSALFTVLFNVHSTAQSSDDWLVDPAPFRAEAREHAERREIVLSNGLVRRTFRTEPNFATVALDNLACDRAELRSVRPEASVTINGTEYSIGGLVGQPIHNYLLPEWLDAMKADPMAFQYSGFVMDKPRARFEWKPRREWMSAGVDWPPRGVALDLYFAPPADAAALKDIVVVVHYELYDALPVICKWISVHNNGSAPITIDSFNAEILAAVEPGSMVGGTSNDFNALPRMIQVETDFSFGGSMDSGLDVQGARWTTDPLYQTQVNYERLTPCLLLCGPQVGPGALVAPGGVFESFRVFELFHDTMDRERRGLASRRMYRAMAPWVQENPLIFHAGSAAPDAVRRAVDQAAEVGFELVIMTFGSGFNIENTDPTYLTQLKELADYAHAKGVALGGYSLLASRSVDAENDVVNPKTGKPGGFARFGNSPCIGSSWGERYFKTLYAAFEQTGMDVLEHDGSYPGDVCASTAHPGHRALADSQWNQWRTITSFYQWCRARGVYLNVPDWYFLSGSNKTGMGYRETNWSLPRQQQEIIERQNIFDGTWIKTPSMGWMFVPLMEYHGGGPAATIEPLDQHLDHYERRLDNLLGAGVQACFRGPRLFDTDHTRDMVKQRVAWFKQHRAILESDIIHGRRADGRDLDWILHANPTLAEPGMLVVYNPLAHRVSRNLRVNFHYTGVRAKATLTGADGTTATIELGLDASASVPVSVPARSMAWWTITPAAR